MTHLLDTSAFLAFFLEESGGATVRDLFGDDDNGIVISVLSVAEFWARLKSLNEEEQFEAEWDLHKGLFDAVLDVDRRVTERAIAIRRATPERLPTIDSLIAATASVHDLILVHRDPHFRPIPESLLRQLDLAGPLSS